MYSFLRLVMALPFLPHEHIRDAFLDLDDNYTWLLDPTHAATKKTDSKYGASV